MVMTLNHNSKWTISVKKVKIRFKMINNISISVKIFQNILFHVAIKYILTRFVRSRSTDRYAWTTNLSVRWSVLVFLIKIDYFFFRYVTICQKCPINPMPFVVTMESHIQIRWEFLVFFGFFGFLDLCHQKYDFYSYQLGLLAVKA